jgi:MFS family permease
VTLLLMGISTAAIALIPPYAQIGIWGGIALTSLRLLQGLGVGCEWGGAVLLAVEWLIAVAAVSWGVGRRSACRLAQDWPTRRC